MSDKTKVIFPNRNIVDVATELTVSYIKSRTALTPDEIAAAYETFYLKAADMYNNAFRLVRNRED